MTEAQATAQHAAPEHELTPEENLSLNTLGMWVFLAGEVLFFGAIFTIFLIYRLVYPQVFAEASHHLNLLLGTVNTAILLTSSFTMALSVNAAQTGRNRALVFLLLSTLILGTVFLGLKGVEYAQEFRENLYPGGNFVFPGPGAQVARIFFGLYFLLTGLHAIHMLIGMSLLLLLAFFAWRKKFDAENFVPVELVGLFWHFVDLVWIFIFSLLYLVS